MYMLNKLIFLGIIICLPFKCLGAPETLLIVEPATGVSPFALWSQRGTNCPRGFKFYRNDFIDKINNDCAEYIYVYIYTSHGKFYIKYSRPFPGFSLEEIFLQNVNYALRDSDHSKSLTHQPTYQYFTNADNFEYVWLNGNNGTHAAIYYEHLDPNSPQLMYSVDGIPFQKIKNDSSQLVSERPVDRLEIKVVEEADCKYSYNPSSVENCPSVPSITTVMQPTEISAGDNVTILCNITSTLGVTIIRWEHDTDAVIVDEPAIYHGNTFYSQQLVIYNVSTENVGTYACFAKNAVGEGQGTDVKLVISGPPTVVLPETHQVNVGSNNILDCTVNGVPEVTAVYWTKEGVVINIYDNRYTGSSVNEPSLTIMNAKSNDIGIYSCCAVNSYNNQATSCKSTMLQGSPVVLIDQDYFEIYPDMPIILNCNFTAYPSATLVYWRKSGIKLRSMDAFTGNFSGSPLLTIKQGRFEDRGKYICCVQNAISTQCSSEIVVGAKPNVTIPHTDIKFVRHVDDTVPCMVDSFPAIQTLSWNITIDGLTLVHTGANTAKYVLSATDQSSLTVKTPTFQDSGSYVCIAKNYFGISHSEEVSVAVYGVMVEAPDSSYSVTYGEPVTLNCTVTYAPDLKNVTWYKETTSIPINEGETYSGGTIQDTHLTISNVVFEDGGTYRCRAGNEFEQSSEVSMVLNVTGGLPVVTVSKNYLLVNSTETAILPCTVSGTPDIKTVVWYKEVSDVTTVIPTSASNPSLTISLVRIGDAGNYTCSATNAVGSTNSSTVLNFEVNQVEPMCPCSCIYKQRLEFWAKQNDTNHTMEEWREILAPVLEEIKKNLTVDTSKLSATLRKLTSAPDDRASSESVGLLGIILLSMVVGSLILIDLTSVRRHLTNIRDMGRGNNKN